MNCFELCPSIRIPIKEALSRKSRFVESLEFLHSILILEKTSERINFHDLIEYITFPFFTTYRSGPDVICDEGHILQNEKSKFTKLMMKLKTRRRIVLTGTTLQNNFVQSIYIICFSGFFFSLSSPIKNIVNVIYFQYFLFIV